MKRMKKVLSQAMALALAATLVACSTDTPDNSSTGTGSQNPSTSESTGGTTGDKVLDIQVDVEVASMDAQIATDGTSFEIIAATIEGLYSLDKDGNPIPALATDQTVSEDGLTRTFKLRDDAKWSNGEPVTAHDFVYAWTRLVDPEVGAQYGFIVGVAGIENADAILAGEADLADLGAKALDDHTLEVKLAFPVSFFDSLMTFPSFLPMNEAFMDSVGGNYGTSADTLVANGPFKVTSYEPATTVIELEKNPDYYDAANVNLDGLKFQVIKDSQQAMLSYQNGDLDIVTLAGEQIDLFKDDPEFDTVAAGFLWYMSINTETAGLENTALRTALAQAFDKNLIVNTILKDGSIAADFFVPIALATGPNGDDFRDTADTYLGFDVEAAKASLETAKSELGQDTFEFTMLVEDTESAINVAQVLKSQIETNLEGVTLNLEQMPKKNRLDRMRAGDYDIGLTRWGPDYADPMTYLELFVTDGPYNDGGWGNEDYDALLESAKSGDLANDPEARWEALMEAEGILLGDAALAPVYQSAQAVMIDSAVSGIEFHSVGINRNYKNANIN